MVMIGKNTLKMYSRDRFLVFGLLPIKSALDLILPHIKLF